MKFFTMLSINYCHSIPLFFIIILTLLYCYYCCCCCCWSPPQVASTKITFNQRQENNVMLLYIYRRNVWIKEVEQKSVSKILRKDFLIIYIICPCPKNELYMRESRKCNLIIILKWKQHVCERAFKLIH
jgi:hypothetical protein